MELSARLEAICRLVTPGMRLADVGTDHGLVPVYLMQTGIIPSAVAMDLRPGPLSRAQALVEEYGLSDRITLRLSDGLHELKSGEADCAVIAGMGGDLMLHILQQDSLIAVSLKELVLSPQSEVKRVRAYLRENSWQITTEDMVCEEGKYYPMMRAEYVKNEKMVSEEDGERQNIDDLYGPYLLAVRHPVLQEYLEWERSMIERNLTRISAARSASALVRRQEMEEQLRLNRLAYARTN